MFTCLYIRVEQILINLALILFAIKFYGYLKNQGPDKSFD